MKQLKFICNGEISDGNSDCKFSGSSDSAICTVTKTSNYVHIIVTSTTTWAATYPNYYAVNTHRYIRIYKMIIPRTSSNKYPYMVYARLFNSSAVNPTTYIRTRCFNVLPRTD